MHAKRMDKIATGVLYAISGIIVAILASLILYILVRGLPHVSWHFLTGKSSSYQAGGGIGIQLYNSFFLLVITLVISFPLSLGAGIYLSEYAKKGRLTNLVRTCIEILSSLPSVVVGLFGYLVFVVQFKYGFSIISGALALTVFNLPQMTRNIEDSLQHVHHTQREAGLALGLSRWETVIHVVVPEALPSIITGVVLASGRIFGEALAIQMVVGNSAVVPTSLTTPASTLTSILTMGIGNTVMGTVNNHVLWSLALVLLLMSLAFNSVIKLITKERGKKNYAR